MIASYYMYNDNNLKRLFICFGN